MLDAFRRGEQAALTKIYEHYVDLVATVMRRGAFAGKTLYGAPRSEWQELVQEVFMRAFDEKARLAFDGLRDYHPYLLAIARNVLAAYWRRRGREVLNDDFDNIVAEDPHSEFERRHLEIAAQYVAELPKEEREVYEHRFKAGESQYEAADALRSTRQRIRTLEKKLLAGLDALLKNKNSNPK